MSLWSWIDERRRIAQMEHDTDTLMMVRLFYMAVEAMQRTPDESIAMLHKSRELAEAMQDAWWVQLVNHWELQARLCYKMDFNGTRELATKALEETRKPFYKTFPQRTCLHEDLITGYLRQDPDGYRAEIEGAITSMEQSVSPKLDCYQCFHDLKTDFAIHTGTSDQMLEEGQRYLKVAEGNPHYSASAYGYLCEIAYKRGEWEQVGEYARLMEEAARSAQLDYVIPTAYAWQALFHQQMGDLKQAQHAAMNATTLAQQNLISQRNEYFDVLCAYHEQGKRFGDALKMRERQLQRVIGKAQYRTETHCRVEILRLRKALELPTESALKDARTATEKLKNPAPMLAKIAAYESGS
jgi:hypothetical protein